MWLFYLFKYFILFCKGSRFFKNGTQMTQIFKICADKNLRKSAFLIRVICVLKKLFPCNYPLNLAQFIQRFNRR